MPRRPARGLSSDPGAEFDPSQGHGAQLAPEVRNVLKLTLAFMKAVGADQKDKADNLVVSPYNAMAALSMVSKGAEGTTREELAKTLFGTNGKGLDAATADYAALNEEILKANKGQVELTTANGVWTNNAIVELKEDFADKLKKEFGAEISGENFGPATVDKVNKWASKNTKGLIDKVLDQLNPDDAAVLASALYFKGQWTHKFDKALTEDKDFTADGAKPAKTPTMHQDYGKGAGLSFVQDADYQAVALTYGEEDRKTGKSPTMRIVLVRPTDDGVSARDWLAGQANGTIPQWLDPAAYQKAVGSVELPHLDIKQKHDLIPSLQGLGVRQAFQEGAADFSRMFKKDGEKMYISKVSHDVVFKTDEEGSEAAAVTVVGMTRSASIHRPDPRIDLKLDRSFVFALQDVKTGAVLFMGAVNKPNEEKKADAKPKKKPAAPKRRAM
ncbi:MAG: serpin family protein [Alphaproteobacteria bacterium]|nr:MAG: serpin family protein [Alphaproteobacteria bacterium]